MEARAKIAQLAALDPTAPVRDAVERANRTVEQCWVVLALHLSRLPAPAPRPHHRSVARAVLNDAASRREGQLFTLGNGDFILLFPSPDGGAGLHAALAELFAPDAPDPALILSRWLLPNERHGLETFLDAVPTIVATPASGDPDSILSIVMQLCTDVLPGRVHSLLERQTGVLVAAGGATRMLPLYREIRFSLAMLAARARNVSLTSDPFLFRHLVTKLGWTMMNAVFSELADGGPMLEWAPSGRPLLHLDMSVEAVLSPGLDTLQELTQACGARVAAEISVVDALADLDAFQAARSRLRGAGFGLVLDEVSHHAFSATRLAALKPDLLKLDWSRQLPGAGTVFQDALSAFGASRVILNQADTEETIRWGLAQGIRRFQGRHIDAILAASRISVCPEAAACTVRACAEREAATTRQTRVGCGNLALLDAAAPAAGPAL